MAALRRAVIPEHQRHLCMLIVDEAKHVYNSQTERLLTECRKYNLGFVSATQVLSQIPEDVRSAIYGATAIKIAGGALQSTDAHKLGQEMFTTGDFLRSMQPVRGSHAEWAFYVQEVTTAGAVRVRTAYGVLDALPRQERAPSLVQPPPAPAELQQVSDTTTVPPTHEGSSKSHLSDIELVVTASRRLETLLETHLGAT